MVNPRDMAGNAQEEVCFTCWLLNVLATCLCISVTELLRQVYELSH